MLESVSFLQLFAVLSFLLFAGWLGSLKATNIGPLAYMAVALGGLIFQRLVGDLLNWWLN